MRAGRGYPDGHLTPATAAITTRVVELVRWIQCEDFDDT
jgi:hypothetical protein